MNDLTLYIFSAIAFALMFAVGMFYRPHKSRKR